jgi:hypothetical protein
VRLLGGRRPECDYVGVPTDASVAQVRELRAEGLTPKLIARKLSLPLRDVSRLVAALAAERGRSCEVVGCWVSPGWSDGLRVPAARDWPDGPHLNPGAGMVTALVAREHRHDSVSVCVYLVDAYCLGVKNALGPHIMPSWELRTLRVKAFGGYLGVPVPAPLDLVRHLVFGAVDHARSLGFEPHADFASAADHLGEWTGPSAITFGRDGKPIYVQGPYDDPIQVVRTLERAVGPDGYSFTVEASAVDAAMLSEMDLTVSDLAVPEVLRARR